MTLTLCRSGHSELNVFAADNVVNVQHQANLLLMLTNFAIGAPRTLLHSTRAMVAVANVCILMLHVWRYRFK